MYLLNLIYFANSRIKVIKYHAISSQEENTSLNWMRKKHLIDNFRVEQTNQTKRKQYHTKRRTRYKSQHLDRRAHLEIRSTLHPRAPNSHIHFFQKPKNSIGRREWLDDYIKKLPSTGGAGVNEPGPLFDSAARDQKNGALHFNNRKSFRPLLWEWPKTEKRDNFRIRYHFFHYAFEMCLLRFFQRTWQSYCHQRTCSAKSLLLVLL